MDVFAFYFPQFYEIEENNSWWGKGFTDWDLVKSSQLFDDRQCQPREPIDSNYYDQSDEKTVLSQIALAQNHGLSGFNFYHYWFDGKLMLEKPLEHFKASSGHKLKYCITWANESWTRQWIGRSDVLMQQSSSKDRSIWKDHYLYLKEHFHNEKYLKIDGKPVFCVYRPEILDDLAEYISFFDELAKADGFTGLHWVAMKSYQFANMDNVFSLFQSTIKFQPREYFNNSQRRSSAVSFVESVLRSLPEPMQRPISKLKYTFQQQEGFDYNEFSTWLIENAKTAKQSEYQSIIVDWDNTARYGSKSKFFFNSSPNLFSSTVKRLIAIEESNGKDLLFINAWNEWSEGAYLEPDKKHGLDYLLALKNALKPE